MYQVCKYNITDQNSQQIWIPILFSYYGHGCYGVSTCLLEK